MVVDELVVFMSVSFHKLTQLYTLSWVIKYRKTLTMLLINYAGAFQDTRKEKILSLNLAESYLELDWSLEATNFSFSSGLASQK